MLTSSPNDGCGQSFNRLTFPTKEDTTMQPPLLLRAFNESVWPGLTSHTAGSRGDRNNGREEQRKRNTAIDRGKLRTWQAVARDEFRVSTCLC